MPLLGTIASQFSGKSFGSFESIATVTGTGSSGTVSFTSIPATYKHLQIRGTFFDGTGYSVKMRFNSDTGSNYAYHGLTGTGATANGTAGANPIDFMVIINTNGNVTNIPAVAIIDIHDYASTTKNKTTRTFNGRDENGSGEVELRSGLWQSTSAITRIDISVNGSFTNVTQLALYGIKGA